MAYSYHEVVSDYSKKICIIDSPIDGEIVKKLDPGEVIYVDTESKFWTWTDRSYYKVKKPVKGWINTLTVGEVLHGKHFS